MAEVSNRILYIDGAKGLGMILIVLGHTIHDTFINNWIFSFHVPLFFIISGFFLNPNVAIKDFLYKKWHQIVKPLLVTHIISIIILGSIFYLSSNRNPFNATWILSQFFYIKEYRLPVIWFLYALFWGQIIVYLLIKYFKRYHLLVTLFLFIFVKFFSLYLYTDLIPMCLVQGGCCAVFLSLGYELKLRGTLSNMSSKCELCACIVCLFAANSVPVYMSLAIFPLGLWNVFISFLISLSVLSLFKKVCSMNINSISRLFLNFLSYIGKYSLIILCFHGIEKACQFNKLFEETFLSSLCFFSIRMLILGLLPIVILRIPFLNKIFNTGSEKLNQ